MSDFLERGWARFPMDPELLNWVKAVHPVAVSRVAEPEQQAEWLQCEGTWFVGVDTLPNNTQGRVAGAGPLSGAAYRAAIDLYGELPLHRGQVSVVYPGYPRPRMQEPETAFRYRLKRDAAHVDGLLAIGPDKARMLKERHAYILGLPLNDCSADASPFVIWDGSHHIMRAAFTRALADVPEPEWDHVDLTGIYKEARKQVFDTCKRIELPSHAGEATLVHRFALHGVAPWAEGAKAPQEGRMIVYFRPELPVGSRDWLEMA